MKDNKEITIAFPREATIAYDRPDHSLTIVVPEWSKIDTAEQLKWALLRTHPLRHGNPGTGDELRSLFGLHLAGEDGWEISNFSDYCQIDALMLRACQKLWARTLPTTATA